MKEQQNSDDSDSDNTISFSTSHEDIYGTHKRTRYALKVNLPLLIILITFIFDLMCCLLLLRVINFFRELSLLRLI